jgi:hypothetical protein
LGDSSVLCGAQCQLPDVNKRVVGSVRQDSRENTNFRESMVHDDALFLLLVRVFPPRFPHIATCFILHVMFITKCATQAVFVLRHRQPPVQYSPSERAPSPT